LYFDPINVNEYKNDKYFTIKYLTPSQFKIPLISSTLCPWYGKIGLGKGIKKNVVM
jgi:hypothetical protein